ncbi:hypothetical protein V8F20_001248 [Naviculisporaceae sp. PSN 640]
MTEFFSTTTARPVIYNTTNSPSTSSAYLSYRTTAFIGPRAVEMEPGGPFKNVTLSENQLIIDDLIISFHRTIRVPDGNQQTSQLPPSEGEFPLFSVAKYSKNTQMPPEMAAKGGLFMPVHDQEAMWIDFYSVKAYAIKVFVGGVNAVSGEPAVETTASRMRRAKRISEGKSVQDYVVVPDQEWLDGFVTRIGLVRQFVATPMGSGYSVEKQILGEENIGGLRMEVTPLKEYVQVQMKPPNIATVWGAKVTNTAGEVKALLVRHREWSSEDKESDMALWKQGQELRDTDVLASRGLVNGDFLVLRPKSKSTSYFTRVDSQRQHKNDLPVRTKEARVAPSGKSRKLQQNPSLATVKEMNVAAGGAIHQKIMPDPYLLPLSNDGSDTESVTVDGTEIDINNPWDSTKTVRFNVQLLNAASFTAITGLVPHPSPLTAERYAELGYPFFKMPASEPETNVEGDFGNLQSIAQMQDVEEDEVYPEVLEIGSKNVLPRDYHEDLLLNPETFFERARL